MRSQRQAPATLLVPFQSDVLARRIVEALFTNGSGQRAKRLVLTASDGSDLGGWGEVPACDIIDDILRGAR